MQVPPINLLEEIPNVYYTEAELAMCSPEVVEACKGMGTYMAGTPTQMELVMQLRKLNNHIESGIMPQMDKHGRLRIVIEEAKQ